MLRAGHITPTGDTGSDDWAMSYWADKSSAATQFALPDDVVQRQGICGASTDHVCSTLADSGGPVSSAAYGTLTSSADAASANATMWTIVLPRAAVQWCRDEGTRDEGTRDAQTTRNPHPGPDGDRSDGRDGSREAPAPNRGRPPGPAPVRRSI